MLDQVLEQNLMVRKPGVSAVRWRTYWAAKRSKKMRGLGWEEMDKWNLQT